MTIRMLNLKDIRIDGGTQFREQIDQDKIKEYKEDMLNGAEFPPMQTAFDGTHYWLWDGFHRYFTLMALGISQIEVDYKPGTQEDAQDWALSANSKHGLTRSNATKRNQVEFALSTDRHKNKSNREIAKLCDVSDPFVAAVRSPEAKKRQAKNIEKYFEKKISKNDVSAIKLHPDDDQKPSLTQDFSPSDDELLANQRRMQADLDLINKMIESDDVVATLHEEIKKLIDDNISLQSRVDALMREKDKAVELLQKAQRENDKLRKAKK